MAACQLISLVTVPAGEAIFTVADYCIASCLEDAPFARIWQASSFIVILPPNYFLLKHMESGFVQEVNCLLESMLPCFIGLYTSIVLSECHPVSDVLIYFTCIFFDCQRGESVPTWSILLCPKRLKYKVYIVAHNYMIKGSHNM
jgi:hypothetical protein